jgi:hypothetical protein
MDSRAPSAAAKGHYGSVAGKGTVEAKGRVGFIEFTSLREKN